LSEDRAASTPDEALALATRAGIHRLAIPTPFVVGRVNCYLIEDDPLTLVDTGPNSGKSLDCIEQELAQRGYTIEDLELIVITHQHMDHLGLLEILARRSGAEIAAHHLLAPYLENARDSMAADDDFAREIMRRNGVPGDLVSVIAAVGSAYRAFGSSGQVTRALHDGDELTFRDRSLRVLHRPGHSPSDLVFLDQERGVLLAGDHVLGHISPNPLVSRPLGANGEGPGLHALLDYIDSMRATRELPANLVLTGHGDPVTDLPGLIDERLRMHSRRARKVLGTLQEQPRTAYEIAFQMWGNVALTQAYLTLSEVLGHVDLLLEQGSVRPCESGDVVQFEAVDTHG
jgi:glyoxylase-like metal-dependent hydrolase (beta-lactamase superfamily II)